MYRYFKNITTFRAIFLLMLLAALGLGVYVLARHSALSSEGEIKRRQLEALGMGAEKIGLRLAAIEAAGIMLVEKFENAAREGEGKPDKVTGEMLEQTLATAPQIVEGAGIDRRFGGVRETSLRTRGDTYFTTPPAVIAGSAHSQEIDTPREINLGRSMGWHIAVASSDGGSEHFSLLLAVSTREDIKTAVGNSLVKSELSWLAQVLADLEHSGESRFFCLTPQDEMLWQSDGNLHFKTGAIHDRPPGAFLMAQVDEIHSGKDSGPGFRMVDVGGTGWRLVSARIPVGGSASVAIIMAVIAVAALSLELAVRGAAGSEPSRAAAEALPKERLAPEGLLAHLHELMFKYRITNPDKDRLDSELRMARQIQFSLLPTSYPGHSEWREYDLCASLHPAREIGGDYYDFFTLGPNRIAIAVGDVSGKGMPAALYMAVARTAFRALARVADDPGKLLSRVNEMLVRDNKSGLYVTVACFFVDIPSGKCQYSIAGHPAPMLRRAGEKGGELLDHPRETVVGMQAGVTYPVGEIQLRPGDTLLLYTDGITEARNPTGEDLEYQGLFDMFDAAAAEKSCCCIIERLEKDVLAYVGEAEQQDDMTLLAYRYWGPGGEKLANEPKRGTSRMVAGPGPQAPRPPKSESASG